MMFFATFALLAVSSLSSLVSAVPIAPINPGTVAKAPSCSLAGIKPDLTGTTLTVPSGNLTTIALGVGTQNYTCGSTGTFASAGAVATLFDVSHLAKSSSVLNSLPGMAFAVASTAKGAALVGKLGPILQATPFEFAQHYFIPNPAVGGTGLTPVFDARSASKKGDPNAFAAVKKIANSAATTDPTHNVDWLLLENMGGVVGGALAQHVMRLNTKNGQPATSCSPNATSTVPYAALYWFYT